MLAQEPFLMKPWEIGRLTDWQIENLYRKPAEERAEQFKRDFPDKSGEPPLGTRRADGAVADIGEPGSPAHRNWVLSAFMNGPLRMTPEQAKALYEKQMSQWKVGK